MANLKKPQMNTTTIKAHKDTAHNGTDIEKTPSSTTHN